MDTYGYEWEAAELAFRTSQRPELALRPGVIDPQYEEQLITITNRWIDDWSSSAASFLEDDLKRLVTASEEQLGVLSKLLKDAEIELPVSDLPDPLPTFAWEPAASGGVLALLDVAVDVDNEFLVQGIWAKQASASLDTERFERVTGIASPDHEIVLRCAERAVLGLAPPDSVTELLYRDRHVWLSWTVEGIDVKHLSS